MSVSSAEPAEPQPETPAPPQPKGPQWSFVALIDHDGQEPPANISESEALGTWCAVSALWHPSLLSRAGVLPRIEPVDSPSPPSAQEVRVVAAGGIERLPSGYRIQAEDAGTILVDGGNDRLAFVQELCARVGQAPAPSG